VAKIKIEFELEDLDMEYLQDLRQWLIDSLDEDDYDFIDFDQVLRATIRRQHSAQQSVQATIATSPKVE